MESTTSAVNPHEKFIRKCMSKKSFLRGFLRSYVPTELLEQFAIDSLQIETVDFNHDLPKESTVAFVYNVEWLDKDGHAYFIVVFQNAADRLIAFRMEKFIHSVMDHGLKMSGMKKLPFVYALVMNHSAADAELRIPLEYRSDLH